jgi:hypothetical protein
MKGIADAVNRELEWTQPRALKMQYELRADDEVVATLGFRSSFGSFATAESADGCWTFKRVGFFQTKVTIRACSEDKEIAVFRNNTWSGGGTLELPDGRRILATTNLWQSKLEFKTESGQTMLQFHSGGLLHLSASVNIDPEAIKMAEPWLVMLGWYLIVMMHVDSAAAVG